MPLWSATALAASSAPVARLRKSGMLPATAAVAPAAAAATAPASTPEFTHSVVDKRLPAAGAAAAVVPASGVVATPSSKAVEAGAEAEEEREARAASAALSAANTRIFVRSSVELEDRSAGKQADRHTGNRQKRVREERRGEGGEGRER